MSQPSTTAVSRFQFRNRLSFQEYSSFAHKSDFLSKTFFRFLSNRNSRIPLKDDYATQITLGRASTLWMRLGMENVQGITPRILRPPEGEMISQVQSWLDLLLPGPS